MSQSDKGRVKNSPSFFLFVFSFFVFFLFFSTSKRGSGSYLSLKRLANCLPTLPKTAQLFANIVEDGPKRFANIAIH